MTASWPSSLPQKPKRGSFAEQRQTNIRKFVPDVGAPKMRRRSSASAVLSTATFILTANQLSDFNEFYEDALADGSLPFEWDHPRTGLTYLWAFDPDSPPKFEDQSPYTQLSISLLRLP